MSGGADFVRVTPRGRRSPIPPDLALGKLGVDGSWGRGDVFCHVSGMHLGIWGRGDGGTWGLQKRTSEQVLVTDFSDLVTDLPVPSGLARELDAIV